MKTLMVSGQKPRNYEVIHQDQHSAPTRQSPLANPAPTPDSVQIALLQGQLEVANTRVELAALAAAHDGLNRQVLDLRAQVEEQKRRWQIERSDHRLDLEAERDRTRALEAELRALRELHGVSWWQKLLGGPTAPALEAK